MLRKTILSAGIFSLLALGISNAGEKEVYSDILEDYKGSVVTIEAVVETEVRAMGQAQESENRIEVPGALINENGLVMASAQPFSSDVIEDALGGAAGGQDFDTDVSVSDISVVLDDGEEFDAFIAATDSDFKLAFLQMEDVEFRSFSHIDFDNESEPEQGEKLYTISRLGEGYDYAPHVRYLQIEGEVDRPRQAHIASAYPNLIGMPFFNEEGEVAGVLTDLDVEDDDPAGGGRFGAMLDQLHGGEDPTLNFVVSIDQVSGLIDRAEERAEDMLDERE